LGRASMQTKHAFGSAVVCSCAVVRTDKSMHSAERCGAAAVSDCAGAGRCRCLGQTEHAFSRAAARASEVADCAGAGRCRCAAGTSRTWWSRRTACPSPTTPPRLCAHVCVIHASIVYACKLHARACMSLYMCKSLVRGYRLGVLPVGVAYVHVHVVVMQVTCKYHVCASLSLSSLLSSRLQVTCKYYVCAHVYMIRASLSLSSLLSSLFSCIMCAHLSLSPLFSLLACKSRASIMCAHMYT
jgi:hypothetical protein